MAISKVDRVVSRPTEEEMDGMASFSSPKLYLYFMFLSSFRLKECQKEAFNSNYCALVGKAFGFSINCDCQRGLRARLEP